VRIYADFVYYLHFSTFSFVLVKWFQLQQSRVLIYYQVQNRPSVLVLQKQALFCCSNPFCMPSVQMSFTFIVVGWAALHGL